MFSLVKRHEIFHRLRAIPILSENRSLDSNNWRSNVEGRSFLESYSNAYCCPISSWPRHRSWEEGRKKTKEGRARNFRPAINRGSGEKGLFSKSVSNGWCTGSFTNLLLERIFARLLGEKSSDASQRVIGRPENIYIYIYRPFSVLAPLSTGLMSFHGRLLRLSSRSPAQQPCPPSIFSDPCDSTRFGTRGGYPSGHQTWIPSADSSRTCVCSTVDRCAWNK